MKKGQIVKWGIIILVSIILLVFIHRNRIYIELATKAQDTPFLKQLLDIEEDPNYYKTKEQYLEMIKDYEQQIFRLESDKLLLESDIEELNQQIELLKVYEDQYETFRQEQREWNIEIANQNPEYFISYYENIHEQDAMLIYRELKEEQIITQEQKEYADTIAKMDERMAARALEVLLTEDAELVKYIIEGMKDDKRASILDNMQADNAAQVIQLISPEI